MTTDIVNNPQTRDVVGNRSYAIFFFHETRDGSVPRAAASFVSPSKSAPFVPPRPANRCCSRSSARRQPQKGHLS